MNELLRQMRKVHRAEKHGGRLIDCRRCKKAVELFQRAGE